MAKEKTNKKNIILPDYKITAINGVKISDIRDEMDLRRILLNQPRIKINDNGEPTKRTT